MTLQPCPFCGSSGKSLQVQMQSSRFDGTPSQCMAIRCAVCEAQGPAGYYFKENAGQKDADIAREAWNERRSNEMGEMKSLADLSLTELWPMLRDVERFAGPDSQASDTLRRLIAEREAETKLEDTHDPQEEVTVRIGSSDDVWS